MKAKKEQHSEQEQEQMAELVWKKKQQQMGGTEGSNLAASRPPIELITMEETSEVNNEPGWSNRLIWGDNQDILPALLPLFRDQVNLIYIDPPFMTGRTFGRKEQLAYSDTWNNDIDAYLQWLYPILQTLHQLLAPTGSMYLHLDWRTSHYVKVMLDEIFGFNVQGNGGGFKNEIIWHYQSGGQTRRYYTRKHDTILFYTKSGNYCFHKERIGERRGAQKRNHMRQVVGPNGQISWTIKSAGKLYTYSEDTLIPPSDVWSDISHLHQRDPERTGYATQKPTALLERILLASSEDDDLVMDCFCGSGVTPIVAEHLKRRWIACDKSELAITTTSQRLQQHTLHYPYKRLYTLQAKESNFG
ncbi:DNA methyltransferase [Ktedonobacter sp. SOSP1-85]|uniref:DNA methyltransferase n=1 Tax=Ktedonobacter sp. SOSP1-85 TaxID=2778367 RepID=UPI001915EA80|nr:site-specific DNA-methyltransferase [Ktedonobacter sp. SOSP1-85]